MGLWKWVTGRLTVKKGWNAWAQIYGVADDDSGQSITPDSAMKLSAWWAARRLITETIATLPASVIEKRNGESVPRPDHPLSKLLMEEPNDYQTPVEFWEGRVGPLCDRGNSYAEKRYVGDRPVLIAPLAVDNCEPFRDEFTNALKYKVVDRGKEEILPADKVFHIRGFGGDDGDIGLSPVAYAARSLGGAMAADRAAARVYGKGLRATGFWKPPHDLDQQQREDFQKNYIKPMTGPEGQGRSPVMPPGFEWVNMNINPRDAELLMTRGFNVADVCRWMGVPPILIGHAQEGQTMWGSGVEQIILGWLVLGLRAYLKRIESAVNLRLVTPAERGRIKFEFNIEGLLRADSAGRAQLMASLAQNGLRTRNELRKLDNYPAVDDGNDLTVQSNLVPLGALGAQETNANAVRNALRAWLIDERESERKAP